MQLDLTLSEQNAIGHSMAEIAGILFNKMDEGVTEPCIEGTFEVVKSNKIIEYTITAKSK